MTLQRNILSKLSDTLHQKFKHDLLSIVIFGSTVKGNSTITSDIDVMVVCDSLIKDWRMRDTMSLELTEDIESKYSIPIHMTLVSRVEFSQAIDSAYPLMLEIYEANEIIYDNDNFFSQSLKNFEKNLNKWHAKRIEKGFWKIPGLAVIESG